jgi:nitrate reductase assembly molybdenum cofactor insertion protein NarJ
MKTIQQLMAEINENVAALNNALEQLNEPFAGFIDTEAVEQMEQERNVDHANDGKI